jgi:imidazolonepropionase-like amidohydrolase
MRRQFYSKLFRGWRMVLVSWRLTATSLGALLLLAGLSYQTSLAQAPATATIALTGARLIDGAGGAPIERATLVIREGRVQAAGAANAVAIPAGAVRVDLAGKTIIPGLIDAHAHVNADADSAISARDQLAAQLLLYGQYGVTTVVSLGDDGLESVKLRDELARGTPDRARLYVAGPNLVAPTAEQARQLVDRNAALKVDFIKTRLNGNAGDMTPAVYRALIEQAHNRGLLVAAHMFSLQGARGLLEAGVDVLAHSVRDQDVNAAFIAEIKRRNAGYIPTLTRDLSVFVYETTPEFFSDPFFLRHIASYRMQMTQLSDPALQQRTRNSQEAQAIKQALQQASRNLKLLADGGVTIAMGTDSGASLGRWQGYFEHTELELMVQAGLSPMQALVAATGNAARVMKLIKPASCSRANGPTSWCSTPILTEIRNTQRSTRCGSPAAAWQMRPDKT